MVFTIKPTRHTNLTKVKSFWNARRTIFYYPMGVNELRLNNYFNTNYKKSLKEICYLILGSARYSINNQNEIIITFCDNKLDKLATMITYGNGILQGSDILKYAFGRL